MSVHSYFISEAVVRNFKQTAHRRLSGVSSSHLSEGLAVALGFNTHAALRAALKGRPTAAAEKPSNARLAARLHQLGYPDVPNDLHVLPELDRSYTPFRSFPLRVRRSARWTAWRNLVVAAINAGLEQRLFGLSPGEDWWPGADPKTHKTMRHTYRFVFDNGVSAVASVDSKSGDELSIHAMLNPRNEDIEPHLSDGLKDADAIAQCWLERRLGIWVQDGGEFFSCKRATQAQIANMHINPMGYADQGSFIL